MLRYTLFSPKTVTFACILGGLCVMGCKSELDNKQSAKVEEAPLPKPAAEEVKEKAPESQTLTLDDKSSSISFVGAKVTADHKGTFSDISGSVTLTGSEPSKLEVTVKLPSVETDEEKLTAHLKSPDFFDTEKFPEAKFVATKFTKSGDKYQVTGTLDLHGVKKQLTFPASINSAEGSASGKAEFKINRKDFGIEYPGMPDDLIKDDVLLKLDLKFKS